MRQLIVNLGYFSPPPPTLKNASLPLLLHVFFRIRKIESSAQHCGVNSRTHIIEMIFTDDQAILS